MRDGLLFLHIIGAAGWIGGGLYGWFSHVQLARNAETSGGALTTLAKTADRYFGPVAGLTLITGVALVWTQDAWGWNDAFVLIGIGVFVFSAAYQPLVAAKTEERLLSAVGSGEGIDAAIGASHGTFAVDVAVVLVALWSMVVKLGA